MSIYKELNDKDWLIQKYEVEKLSTLQIAKIIGAKQCNSVRQALIKNGVKVRNFREGQTVNKIDAVIDDEDAIVGSLLGDGSLNISNKHGKLCQPYISKKSKHQDHAQWFANQVSKDPRINYVEEFKKFPNPKYNKVCSYYTIRTNSSEKLRKYFDEWYPKENDYKKIVPANLILNPKKVLHWFLDDGYSIHRDRSNEYKALGKDWEQRSKQISVGFCSESFTEDENNFLVELLKEINIQAYVGKISKGGSRRRIFINQSKIQDFFTIIGPPPFESLSYKWK